VNYKLRHNSGLAEQAPDFSRFCRRSFSRQEEQALPRNL